MLIQLDLLVLHFFNKINMNETWTRHIVLTTNSLIPYYDGLDRAVMQGQCSNLKKNPCESVILSDLLACLLMKQAAFWYCKRLQQQYRLSRRIRTNGNEKKSQNGKYYRLMVFSVLFSSDPELCPVEQTAWTTESGKKTRWMGFWANLKTWCCQNLLIRHFGGGKFHKLNARNDFPGRFRSIKKLQRISAKCPNRTLPGANLASKYLYRTDNSF